MPSFPQMRDLPTVLGTEGWQWVPFQAPVAPSHNFWIGTDRDGSRWLTKLTGDFCAYREIVFARLAQSMGWSCQSSVFIRVDAESARTLKVKPGEFHAAHWFLNEHAHPPCSHGCQLEPLVGFAVGALEDLVGLDIAHIRDWPKSELAACLFGGNEPPGRLFTMAHEFVIIDAERMFSSGPCSFESTRWWGDKSDPNPSGLELAREVCTELVALGNHSLNTVLALPPGLRVQERWPIAFFVRKSFSYALAFIAQLRGA